MQVCQRGRANLERSLLFRLHRRKKEQWLRVWSWLQPYLPEVLDTNTKQIMEKVTASFKEELKALINNSVFNHQISQISTCTSNLSASLPRFEDLAQEQKKNSSQWKPKINSLKLEVSWQKKVSFFCKLRKGMM